MVLDHDRIFLNIGLIAISGIIGVFLLHSVRKENKTRKQIENLTEQLKKANAQLTEFTKQKSEFLSIASHQFRTPLTAIKGYSSMLLEGSFGQMSEQVRDAVNRVYQSSEDLVSVIDDFLNVSHIELGRMRYDFEVIDFKKFLQETIEIEKHAIDKSTLRFNILIPQEDDITVTIDTKKIQQVIFNLIENAIKSTSKGMVTIALTKTSEYMRFSIKDTGAGVAKKEQTLLFKKFSHARGRRFNHIRGSGLGLYVAKEILNKHFGNIWMESEGEGLGSIFYFELPIGKNEKLLKKRKPDEFFNNTNMSQTTQ